MRITLNILALTLAAVPCGAAAQAYPVKPIRLIVPSTPGGSVDTVARTVGPRLGEKWGQQVIVDNRSGAGGAIAGEMVAKSPPDGYMLLVGTIASLATNVSLQKKLPYDPVRDFAPITLLATQNLMLLVHPSLPVKTVKELTALAKKRPGSLSFSSAGNGTGGHLSGELYKMLAGVDLLHVPYKGVTPAMVDIISGQVTMTFASILSGSQQVKAGRLRALAVTGGHRSSAMPELATMVEAGVAGYESATWYGIVAQAGTPADIVNKINAEMKRAVADPALIKHLEGIGMVPTWTSPKEMGEMIRTELARWQKVVSEAGIKPE